MAPKSEIIGDGTTGPTEIYTGSKVCVHLVSTGWHEELDRKLSQHSLGELTKFGSKTALNRRVSRLSPVWLTCSNRLLV